MKKQFEEDKGKEWYISHIKELQNHIEELEKQNDTLYKISIGVTIAALIVVFLS